MRQVETGTMLDDAVVIQAGLSAGEHVAASGSFKLREGTLVAIAGGQQGQREQGQVIGKR